jgi:hypothetical protein
MKLKFKLNLQQFGNTRTVNGVEYNINVAGTNANWNLDAQNKKDLLEKIVELGRPLTDAELVALNLIDAGGNRIGSDRFKNVKAAMNQIITQNATKLGFDTVGNKYDTTTGTLIETGVAAPTGEDGKVSAFNEYYQDVYSLAPGTGGKEMLNRLEQSYTNQAQQAATMADVGFQQAAMQQANTVKQITDQVRAERMARLRAGMSESQIANQDMQMLMTNVNTLNQNAQMLNDQRLQAQVGINTAQDQAYTDFLNQANARGQIATGMAASDAGDPYQQTIRQMTSLYGNDPTKWTASQWSTVSNQVTGQNQPK